MNLSHRSPRFLHLVLLLLCVLSLSVSCSGGSASTSDQHDVLCPLYAPELLPAPSGPHDSPTEPAGTIAGAFSVSRTGEAVYTMPLVVPPGRAGVQPALSLVYDSNRGDGLLGVGFALSGLSSITRCPHNIAQDGRVRGVRDDEEDKLCLDGLRLVSIRSARGPRFGRIDEYRTFPDTFQRVLAHYPAGWAEKKGPQFFHVYTKPGRVLEYGVETSGRVLGVHGVVRAWWVTREADRRDNAILYRYVNDVDPSDGHTFLHAPLRIDYTDHPDAHASRAVRFETTSWGAQASGYLRGTRVDRSTRIRKIVMLGPGDQPVRSYLLHHGASPATGRARLASVEECAGDGSGACKPPTRFGWLDAAPGFTTIPTAISHPSYATDTSYTWVATDLDGDGLPDLTIARADASGAKEEWLTALGNGSGFGPLTLGRTTELPWLAANPTELDPLALGRFNIVPHPYDLFGINGLLFNDLFGGHVTWLKRAADGALSWNTTPIEVEGRVFMGVATSAGVLYADVDGDGVPDVVQCAESTVASGSPDMTSGVWTLRRWRLDVGGFGGRFGDPEPIAALGARNCTVLRDLKPIDVDGDGKTELLAPPYGYPSAELGPGCEAPCTYQVLAWDPKGWTSNDTRLPPPAAPVHGYASSILFADVNGDGLPDAIEIGFADGLPRTFLNTGDGFADPVVSAPVDDETLPFAMRRAVTLDYDGDGQSDLVVPMKGHCGDPDADEVCFVVWQASAAADGTFTLIDTGIPVMNPPAAGRRTWLAPQATDIDGDGRADIIYPYGGHFTVLRSAGPSDLLTSITDGLNPLDPGDAGFTPNVTIAYDNLLDRAKTNALPADSPAREGETYLPHTEQNNCTYPRTCVVGGRRVVRAYQTNDGNNQKRTFTVRYRDGRYDRALGAFLGFGTRIVTDLDVLAGELTHFDNHTWDPGLRAYPFAGTPEHVWTWSPSLPATVAPIELSYTDSSLEVVPTNGGATFFVRPTRVHELREQGSYPIPGSTQTILEYVAATAESPETILRESQSDAQQADAFGNVLRRVDHTVGIDEIRVVERTVDIDEARWLIGLVTREEECGVTSGGSACRVTARTFDQHGELLTEQRGDPSDPETQVTASFVHDGFGNVVRSSADDAFGHHRSACMRYEAEGIFPFAIANPAGHIALLGFDPALGTKVAEVDPNGLGTVWRYDAFGRVAWEIRPDGTSTHVTVARSKDGGPSGGWWRIRTTVEVDGGAKSTTDTDALGRAVRIETRGPDVPACDGAQCTPGATFVEETTYDSFGRVARRSLPHIAGAPAGSVHEELYLRDALGRVVSHVRPWGAVTTFTYDGNTVHADEPGGVHTSTERDALGRAVAVTDGNGGVTSYVYGAFGVLRAATTPDGHVTIAEHDAYGRMREHRDPDRGLTTAHYTGFGERTSTKDALGRITTFTYDASGRLVQRDDADGATVWTYDTAPHGIGALGAVTSPAGAVESYAYDTRGRLAGVTLSLDGESFATSFGYDAKSRLSKITYPAGPGGAFTVRREYDAGGHLQRVRGDTEVYWELTSVDGGGRARGERFGNGTRTERSYFADRGRVRSIVTERADHTALQDLHYDYDKRNNLVERADALQGKAEHFRHDPLDRLTCASLAVCGPIKAGCACDIEVDYEPGGNVLRRSDRGTFKYDIDHPHAVADVGGDVYAYDAVGNQIARPDAKITYTPFDLPRTYTLASDGSTIALDYDGDQRRIRKTTAAAETIYAGGLYERVRRADKASVEHRYHVGNGERVVAVVTRTDDQPKGSTLYVHVDHLGSTDVLTGSDGAESERRSYDAFGARRSPLWGQPAAAALTDMTSLGFTGEEDDELGLVNLRGRIYDPRLGRFLQIDPLVGNPLDGQSWNPYSYALNNPLRFIDRRGLSAEEGGGGGAAAGGGDGGDGAAPGPHDPFVAFEANGNPHEWKPYKTNFERQGVSINLVEGAQINLDAPEVVVTVAPDNSPPSLLDRLGPITPGDRWFAAVVELYGLSAAGAAGLHLAPVAASLISDALFHLPYVTAANFLGFLVLGLAMEAPNEQAVPGVVADAANRAVFLGETSPLASVLEGGGMGVVPTGGSGPGGGASSAGSSAGGGEEAETSTTTGSGSGSASVGGDRPGLPFTRKGKQTVIDASRDSDGNVKCAMCGVVTVPPQRSARGVTPPRNEWQVDHVIPQAKNGSGSPENGQALCRTCNRKKSDKYP